MQKKLDELALHIGGVQEKLNFINTDVSLLDRSIKGMEDNIIVVINTIANIKEEVKDLKADVAEVKAGV